LRDAQQKLTEANAAVFELQGEKRMLADQFDKLRADTENRFTGITTTGKRVVFLVDTSRHLGPVDLRSIALSRPAEVARAVTKVMQSIPKLEHYQIVLFSESARPLEGRGVWLPYEGERTAARVWSALRDVQHRGDSNPYVGFELAFSTQGTRPDTIYLFTGGVPTAGPGLTPEQERAEPPLSEAERSAIRGRYLRKKLTGEWNHWRLGESPVKINVIGFPSDNPNAASFL
jgi:hypothetical protein